jgi:hypothetical protein
MYYNTSAAKSQVLFSEKHNSKQDEEKRICIFFFQMLPGSFSYTTWEGHVISWNGPDPAVYQ